MTPKKKRISAFHIKEDAVRIPGGEPLRLSACAAASPTQACDTAPGRRSLRKEEKGIRTNPRVSRTVHREGCDATWRPALSETMVSTAQPWRAPPGHLHHHLLPDCARVRNILTNLYQLSAQIAAQQRLKNSQTEIPLPNLQKKRTIPRPGQSQSPATPLTVTPTRSKEKRIPAPRASPAIYSREEKRILAVSNPCTRLGSQ
jgi:hypothetical protein